MEYQEFGDAWHVASLAAALAAPPALAAEVAAGFEHRPLATAAR